MSVSKCSSSRPQVKVVKSTSSTFNRPGAIQKKMSQKHLLLLLLLGVSPGSPAPNFHYQEDEFRLDSNTFVQPATPSFKKVLPFSARELITRFEPFNDHGRSNKEEDKNSLYLRWLGSTPAIPTTLEVPFYVSICIS